MAENSNIEWTHATWNPWRGCTKVSDGCKFCYAETLSARNPAVLGTWGPKGERVIASESYWKQPLAWNQAAQAEGVRRRVFCASLADVFEGEDTMPQASVEPVMKARIRLFHTILNTPHLDWLLLTKRPHLIKAILRAVQIRVMNDQYGGVSPEMAGAVAAMLTKWLRGVPPANVWLGTSVENQEAADLRIPFLLEVPAAVRFLSMEPLLGPVDISRWFAVQSLQQGIWQSTCALNWVITGGKSGPHARPANPDWFRSLRDQCVAAGVPYLHKQHGEWGSEQEHLNPGKDNILWTSKQPVHFFDETPGRSVMVRRMGKHVCGRTLDLREWNEFPTTPLEGASR